MSVPALRAAKVRVEVSSGEAVIDGVDLQVAPGEIVGLVGESGSGKTTTALSIFGYNAPGLKMTAGEFALAGRELTSAAQFRAARGREVSYVPQNPGGALNPSLRVAKAIEDMIPEEKRVPQAAHLLLERVSLPADAEFARRYPHQLSGGQQQRVCIASSLAPEPALVVLDEPTTGLDVVTQDRILTELLRLRAEQRVAMLYITHDLAVVAQIASRIAVMYAGHVVEQGPIAELLLHPRHPYTRGLIEATPDHRRPRRLGAMPGIQPGVGERPAGCPFGPRCPQRTDDCELALPPLGRIGEAHEVRCIHWRSTPAVEWRSAEPPATQVRRVAASPILAVEDLRAEYRSGRSVHVAAQDISFTLPTRGSVALVGESGSGKTTIARTIAGLHAGTSGRVLLDGEPLASHARRRSVEQRRRIQLIFQNPAEALNPRHTVGSSIGRPARVLGGASKQAAEAEVTRLLEAVRLPARISGRYPHELSGGERQRVAIARALAAKPDVLVCDEITSALDVSVQAVVLELLRELREELSLAIVFISHDLGVVATIAEQVIVLQDGRIRERGVTSGVLNAPEHEYTQRLLKAAPSLSDAIERWGVIDTMSSVG